MKTSFCTYLRVHLKSRLKSLLFISCLALIFTVLIATEAQIDNKSYYLEPRYSSTLSLPTIVLVVSCYIAPVMEFSFFKKRRNLDCIYALPISRQVIGIVHYLSGLLLIIMPFSLSYVSNYLLLLRNPQAYDLQPLLSGYFTLLGLGLCFYSLFCFVFNEANTKGDGIWFMILWSWVLLFALSGIASLLEIRIEYTSYGTPIVFISNVCMCYSLAVEMQKSLYYINPWHNPTMLIWMGCWLAIGIGSVCGLFFTFGKRAMEKTEDISDSWFGYRTLIPVFAISSMVVIGSGLGSIDIILWCIIALLAVIGYTIYRRGFHYKKSDIIILISLLIFLVL